MPANNRIYYASQAVMLQPQNADGTQLGSWMAPQGLQSVGMTTNFNLEQVFQLGQLELYDNLENVPEVEVTLNKVIDGTPTLYCMAMGGTANIASWQTPKELASVATNRVNFKLGIYPDTSIAATGQATHWVACSGMYLSAFTYTFPVEGNSTEEITLVGNSKVWNSGVLGGAPNFNEFRSNTNPVRYDAKAPGVVRRYNVRVEDSALPTGNAGIPLPFGAGAQGDELRNRPYLNSMSISANLGREAIFELGRMAPYFRYVNFPVEITSEFEVTASDGDKVNADDFTGKVGCGVYTNLVDKEIRLVVCGSGANDRLQLDLGRKNKLTSVNYSGGDTGGGNATITYSFQTFNKFAVTSSGSYSEVKWVDNTSDPDMYLE